MSEYVFKACVLSSLLVLLLLLAHRTGHGKPPLIIAMRAQPTGIRCMHCKLAHLNRLIQSIKGAAVYLQVEMRIPDKLPQLTIVCCSTQDRPFVICRQAEPASPAASTSYLHANAEAMPLDDRSQDMVAASYLVHEMPVHGTKGFLRDAHRVLRPGGVIAIVDGDPW